MAQLEPGGTFAHYRIVERLGQGGQADAFRYHKLAVRYDSTIHSRRSASGSDPTP